ncbi:DUF6335 family protein [Baaleninema sp.]|uniref:DUF6335 family protein n=1 Tax=Baaleninema sp. TaxID=3101197 RepID=UPI003CFDFA4D
MNAPHTPQTPDATTPPVRKVEDAISDTKPMVDRQGVDDMATEAGAELAPEEPLHLKDKLEERDEERWQLDADSAQLGGSDPNAETEPAYRREDLDELPEYVLPKNQNKSN